MALPLVALFAVPFAIAIRKDNINGHNIASGIIHIVMAVIIAFSAAGTGIITTVTQTDVYVLADVSYSASKNLDVVDDYVRGLSRNLPDNSRMGVIAFGRDCEIVSHLGDRFKTVKGSDVDESATDIVGALDFAGTLFRENVIKRIVLITDGKQTGESDDNAIRRKVEALTENKIHVDAIYLDDNIKENVKEVQISDVQYTQTVCRGRSEKAVLTVNCNCPETVSGAEAAYEVEAKFTVYKNGELLREIAQRLTRGTNSVEIELDTAEAGTNSYKVDVTAEEDENKVNNTISFTQTVSDNFKVLLICGNSADRDALKGYYEGVYGATEYDEKGNLVRGVKSFSYVKDPEIPYTVEEMCKYDEIVLSDVDATQIPNTKSFLASLDAAVSLFGKSLITFGNTYIQTHATGELKVLSDLLPVVYGASDLDPKLYTLLVDTSRSMEFRNKLTHAKQAAEIMVNTLSDTDKVALVEFNGNSYTHYQPVTLGSYRQSVINTIRGFGLNQGTVMGSAFDMAYQLMSSGEYSERRVMLFSDGVNFGDDAGNLSNTEVGSDGVARSVKDWTEMMRSEGIVTNVFDVGRFSEDGESVINDKRKQALTDIGNKDKDVYGEGYFDISSDEKIKNFELNEAPKIESKSGNALINVKRRGDEVLSGISNGVEGNVNRLDKCYVKGYYYSKLKNSANNVLTLTDEYNYKGKELPLYSYWNYGNGRVATYTGKINNWAIKKDVGDDLFKNILTTNAPAQKNDYPFVLDITEEEGYANIVLTPANVDADAKTSVEITTPYSGDPVKGTLAFGTSDFTYSFVTNNVGDYNVKITYETIHGVYTCERTLSVAYSAEYDSFAMYDPSVLHKAIGSTGIVSEDGNLKIVNDDKEVGKYNLSLTLPLLIACVVLYAVDVAVRKLKWEDIKSFFKRGKKADK